MAGGGWVGVEGVEGGGRVEGVEAGMGGGGRLQFDLLKSFDSTSAPGNSLLIQFVSLH